MWGCFTASRPPAPSLSALGVPHLKELVLCCWCLELVVSHSVGEEVYAIDEHHCNSESGSLRACLDTRYANGACGRIGMDLATTDSCWGSDEVSPCTFPFPPVAVSLLTSLMPELRCSLPMVVLRTLLELSGPH